jgi:site-specific DNA-cytosine methylase
MKISNTSILPEDILNFNIGNVYEKIHNKDTLFAIARTYDSYKEFRKIEKSVCYKLDIMGWLKPATDHMKDKKKKLTMEMVLEKIKKYNTLQDFMVNDRSAYEFINRNKMKHLVSHLSRGHYDIDFTLEDVKTRINQYTTKWEFTKENPRMYEYLRSRRLTYLISNLKSLK